MTAVATTEAIDQVDERNRVVGAVARGEALALGVNFRTAHVLISDGGGRLLLQRLSATRDRHPGSWGSSVAAYVRAGETYAEAAARRVREELGVVIELDPVATLPVPDGESTKFVGLFTGTADRVEIAEPDHIAELRYWETVELSEAVADSPELFTPTLRRLLAATEA